MNLKTFAEMAAKLRTRVLSHLQYHNIPFSHVEDCLQDVFRRVLENLDKFHDENHIFNYMLLDTKNTIPKLWSIRTRREVDKRVYGYGKDTRLHRPQEFMNWRIDLERAAERAVKTRHEHDSQGAIPTRYRNQVVKALLIHVYAGVSLDDLAEELAMPERSLATWHSSLREAKRRLIREMRKGGYGGLR